MSGDSILVEKLSAIQKAIAIGAPLPEVLDAIVQDAWDLLGHDHILGIRTVDPSDGDYVILLASRGLTAEMEEQLRRSPIDEGVGGRAIREDRLVVFDNYELNPEGIPVLVKAHVHAAMATPVHEDGVPIGSLAVATFEPERNYSAAEQMSLMAFAEHASLAIAAAKAAERLREAERDRQLFLAMFAHKLKTPLTVATGAIELLDRGDRLTAEKRQIVIEHARGAVADISRMIDRLLQGSRVELSGVVEELDVASSVRTTAETFAHLRPLTLDDLPQVRARLNADAFKHSLGTILENAVKHSPDGTPILVGGRAARHRFSISVTNVGSLPKGIDPSELFLPMTMGNPIAGGVGLGLYIVKRLTRSMGGDVEVRQETGHVTLEMTLPH